MLTKEQVEIIIDQPEDERMTYARKMNNKLRMHVDGNYDLLQNFLERVNNYENQDQYEARKKLAITNKFLTEELLRPTDNAFNAKGGSKNYLFSTKEKENSLSFIEKLSHVRNGMSLSKYIEDVWFHKLITDPNGLIYIEVKETPDDEEEAIPIPTYKSIHSIKAYEQNGQKVDWVILEPHEIKEVDDKEGGTDKKESFWVVDEEAYYLYSKDKEGLKLEEEKTHDFEEVPGVLCSSIIDNITGWKKSPIDEQIELLDRYVVSNSVLSIADFLYNYPREWTYIDECPACNGTGKFFGSDDKCTTCNGDGKASRTDVTDILKLKIPKGNDIKIDPPMGYVTLPTDAYELMPKSVDRLSNRAFFSQWGTSTEKDTKNETATGRFIDTQPVHNRLDKYSKWIETTHSLISDILGKFYFPETFKKSFIQYGRRYLVETPDQIWEKYLKAKKDNAPKTTLDLLLSQFIESEFRENETMFKYEMKKTKLEPFIHDDIKTVRESEFILKEDKVKKEYFNEWCDNLTIEYVNSKELKALETELVAFATEKLNKLNKDKTKKEDEEVQQTLP